VKMSVWFMVRRRRYCLNSGAAALLPRAM